MDILFELLPGTLTESSYIILKVLSRIIIYCRNAPTHSNPTSGYLIAADVCTDDIVIDAVPAKSLQSSDGVPSIGEREINNAALDAIETS